ncbi:MAG: DNA phosphorothioation system sulfurtransferase DndC [Sulfuricurvum sp.]|jgi:DNA sulfur modification protein DndC
MSENKFANFWLNRYNHTNDKGINFMDQLTQKIAIVKNNLKAEYLSDTRPWVVTFSGGKDSTTVLHLVVDMLLEMRTEGVHHSKKVYIVSSDTGVEMPLIEDYVGNKLDQLRVFSKKENLDIHVEKLTPKVTESFWTLLLGKGYPSPNQTFRWCTDRMKIRPATYFLKGLSDQHQSILMLLGVRSDESVSRAASIEKRIDNHRGFSMHPDIPNAFIYSPIKDWTNAEVWTFLSKFSAPWGKHNDMMVLYDKGSGEGDCNVALNPEAASCGKTRFGCWVCTVVSKDKSMDNMLKNDEDMWMKPLHEFRNLLEEYRDPESGKRQPRRRNGQKSIGPFKLETRKELLEKLLATEQALETELAGKTLIKDEEITQIQEEWLSDGDFFESAIKLAREYGRDVPYQSVKAFNQDEQEYIDSLCHENNINKELIDHIMQCEHSYRHHSIRAKAFGEFETIIERFAKGQLNEI